MNKKLAVISLGCDKNRVDTENMLYYLADAGFSVTDDVSDADAAVINTCAFIERAREEAIDTILDTASYKQRGKLKKLVVTGCLPAMCQEELTRELPEVDAFLGISEYERITEVLCGSPVKAKSFGRVQTTPPHYAYLRVADGCDNHCTFCTIPSIRGKYRSRELSSLLEEANLLAERGVKELILVAQDVTRYGSESGDTLHRLLDRLNDIESFRWIRLMYCYPECVDETLIRMLAANNRIARYIDIPVQHVADAVLKRMNRRSTNRSICDLFSAIRAADPHIEIRTTFMVGFPGETEEDFAALNRFAAAYGLCNAGVFSFSAEAGTPAARLDGQIPEEIKQQRAEILTATIFENNIKRNKAAVGSIVEVLYEDIDFDRECFRGRTEGNAPEVDRNVYFTGTFADAGHFYPVRITGYDGYDLTGEMVEGNGRGK